MMTTRTKINFLKVQNLWFRDVSERPFYSLGFETFYTCFLLQQTLQKVGAEILRFRVTFALSFFIESTSTLSDCL